MEWVQSFVGRHARETWASGNWQVIDRSASWHCETARPYSIRTVTGNNPLWRGRYATSDAAKRAVERWAEAEREREAREIMRKFCVGF